MAAHDSRPAGEKKDGPSERMVLTGGEPLTDEHKDEKLRARIAEHLGRKGIEVLTEAPAEDDPLFKKVQYETLYRFHWISYCDLDIFANRVAKDGVRWVYIEAVFFYSFQKAVNVFRAWLIQKKAPQTSGGGEKTQEAAMAARGDVEPAKSAPAKAADKDEKKPGQASSPPPRFAEIISKNYARVGNELMMRYEIGTPERAPPRFRISIHEKGHPRERDEFGRREQVFHVESTTILNAQSRYLTFKTYWKSEPFLLGDKEAEESARATATAAATRFAREYEDLCEKNEKDAWPDPRDDPAAQSQTSAPVAKRPPPVTPAGEV